MLIGPGISIDADGFFEQFLIYTQMCPQLRNLRNREGISGIHLSIQRCPLDLERGVPESLLIMGLEGSIEPCGKLIIRRPKSIQRCEIQNQLFEEVELGLMQTVMSLSTFGGAIQIYVSVLNSIFSLDVVEYLHDWHEEPTDMSHFFSWTRVSLYTFNYRNLALTNKNRDVLLQPWMEIELDIPFVGSEWDGRASWRLIHASSHSFGTTG